MTQELFEPLILSRRKGKRQEHMGRHAGLDISLLQSVISFYFHIHLRFVWLGQSKLREVRSRGQDLQNAT